MTNKFFSGKPCKNGHISERYVSNRSCVDCLKEQSKELKKKAYAKNPEKFKTRVANYKENNPDKVKETYKKWYANNLDKAKQKWRIRRATKNKISGSHTPKEIYSLMEKQNCLCAICKTSIKNKMHIDHIVPISKGGSDSIYNLQILCPLCNLKKGAKDPFEFMQSKGFLL